MTPSYNQGRFLEATIRSVLLQGYPNLEYIVMDGGSTDGSVEIIKKYEAKLAYWGSARDSGQTDAISTGMRRTTGEIVNWLNSDDILLPNALATLAAKYKSIRDLNASAVLCGGGVYIDETGRIIRELPIRFVAQDERILPTAPPYAGGVQASWFLTRQAWITLGGIDTDLEYTMDTDLSFRCQSSNIPFHPIPSSLAAYRVHHGTKTIRGWKHSIEFKKRFYTGKAMGLDRHDKRRYAERIGMFLFGMCLNSINTGDHMGIRLRKIAKAIEMYPPAMVHRYSLRRALDLLIRGPS